MKKRTKITLISVIAIIFAIITGYAIKNSYALTFLDSNTYNLGVSYGQYQNLPVNHVDIGNLKIMTAEFSTTNSQFLFMSNDNFRISSDDGTESKYVLYHGPVSYGSANSTVSTDMSGRTNNISGSFTLLYRDAATLSDGTKANVKLTVSDISFVLGANTGVTANTAYMELASGSSSTWALCGVPHTTINATDSDTSAKATTRCSMKLDISVIDKTTGNPIGSQYEQMLFGMNDLDVRDNGLASGKTYIERYNGEYAEGVLLKSGFAGPVALAPQTGSTVHTRNLLQVKNIGGDMRLQGDGAKFQAKADDGSVNDYSTFYSGFIVPVRPQGFSFYWYGSTWAMANNIGAQIDGFPKVNVVATAGSGGTIEKPGSTAYILNSRTTYNYTPSAGHKVKSLKVNGQNVTFNQNGGTYTFEKLYANPTSDAAANYTIDVQFEPNAYTVTYQSADNNGTVTGTTNEQVNYNGKPNANVTDTANTGYTSGSWTCKNASGTNVLTNGTLAQIRNLTITSNVTCSIPHNINKYTVTYQSADSNGTVTGTTNEQVNYNGKPNANVTDTANTGYTSGSWTCKNASGTNVLTNGTLAQIRNLSITSNVICSIPHNINKYTVTYQSVNGTIQETSKNETVNYGSNPTGRTNVPNTGYSFEKWTANKKVKLKDNTEIAAGSIITAAQIKNIVVTEDLTLTANNKINTYTVTYQSADNNGTVTGTTNETVNYNNKPNASVTDTAKKGYTSGSWTCKNASGTNVLTNGTLAQIKALTITSNVTCSIPHTPNNYKIDYVLNGGTHGTLHPISANYDTDVIIDNPSKTVTITGNVNGTGATIGQPTSKSQPFTGWTSTTMQDSSKTGTGANPSTDWAGASTKNRYYRNLRNDTGTVTLIANWTPDPIPTPTIDKTGHTCKWNTKADGSGTSYNSGALYTPVANANPNVTLYAVCTINNYLLTADANGGQIKTTTGWTGIGNRSTKSVTYSHPYGLLPTAEREGYRFKGWYSEKTGGTPVSEQTTMGAADTIIWASWNPIPKKEYTGTSYSDNKGLSNHEVKVGDDIKYKISLVNTIEKAEQVVITDVLSKGLTYNNDVAATGGTITNKTTSGSNPTTLTLTVNIPANSTVTVTYSAKVNNSTGYVVSNKATAKYGNEETLNIGELKNPVPKKEYAGTSYEDNQGWDNHEVKEGDNLKYKVTLANVKNSAQTIVVKDVLSKGLTYNDDVEITGGTITNKTASGSNPTILTLTVSVPANETATVTYSAKVNDSAGYVVSNKATTQYGTDPGIETGELKNPVPKKEYAGTSYEDNQGWDNHEVREKDDIKYKVTLANVKNSAQTVVVTDVLSKGLTYNEDAEVDKGDLAVSTPLVNSETKTTSLVHTVTIPANETATLTYSAKVNGDAENLVNNKAQVQYGTDPAIDIGTPYNPVPKKHYDSDTANGMNGKIVQNGDIITYNISYANGYREKAKVSLRDTLSKGLKYKKGSAKICDALKENCKTLEAAGVEETITENEDGTTTIIWKDNNVESLEVKIIVYDVEVTADETRVENDFDIQICKASEEECNAAYTDINGLKNTRPKKEYADDFGNGYGYGAVAKRSRIKYQIVYENVEDEDVTVTIKDTISKGLEYVRGTFKVDGEKISDPSYSNDNKTFTLDRTLEKDKKEVLTYEVLVTGKTSKVSNKATAEYSNNPGYARELDKLENAVPKKEYASNTKAGKNGAEVKKGDVITYSIKFSNTKKEASSVVIMDSLSNGLEYVKGSAKVNGKKLDPVSSEKDSNGQMLVWMKEIESKKDEELTYQVKVTGETRLVQNNASVQYDDDNVIKSDELKNSVKEEKTNNSNKTNSPQTGNNIKMYVWVILISAVGIMSFIYYLINRYVKKKI